MSGTGFPVRLTAGGLVALWPDWFCRGVRCSAKRGTISWHTVTPSLTGNEMGVSVEQPLAVSAAFYSGNFAPLPGGFLSADFNT
jgi:hypothetical protein